MARDRAPQATEFADILADVFRKAGWRVRREPVAGQLRADLLAESESKKYAVELKVGSEGRSDRLLPLLSQAILEIQAFVRRFSKSASPLAVVAARRVPFPVVENIRQFAAHYAPDVGIGIIDLEGLREFVGAGLEKLNAKPPKSGAYQIAAPPHLPDLFSDLNQWMLKVLLGQSLPESLISVPRQPIRNASQLAAAAGVSVMSAFRLVKQLSNQGFLDENSDQLKVVRAGELMERWVAANREAAKEYPARWIIKKGQNQFRSTLQEYSSSNQENPGRGRHQPVRDRKKALPRCCAGLFSAAEVLGLSFVQGNASHVYLEALSREALARLGIIVDPSDPSADLYIRIPANRETIFRASVQHEGIPAADVLQVWLDVSTHPARGREQAREIERRVLKSLIGKYP